jgi:hypothetical protein
MDIIVDIDGTLADCTHRLHHIQKEPKDWDAFFAACGDDAPIKPMLDLILTLRSCEGEGCWRGHNLLFVTGRPERTRAATVKWLRREGFDLWPYLDSPHPRTWTPRLYMRPDDTHADDDTVKRRLLEKIRVDGYEPVLAFEDRKRVVDMWRSEGLVCAQVADGDF